MTAKGDIILKAKQITEELLPAKSKSIDLHEYELFKQWCRENNVTEVSDDIMLVYLSEKSKAFNYYL